MNKYFTKNQVGLEEKKKSGFPNEFIAKNSRERYFCFVQNGVKLKRTIIKFYSVWAMKTPLNLIFNAHAHEPVVVNLSMS